MKLSQVMAGTGAQGAEGVDVEVRALAYDSRRVGPGALFFALPGSQADGAAFARDAVQKGAVAVVAERALELPPGTVQLLASNPRRAMAIAADNFHGRPSRRMTLLAVTGTNGKTTTSWLVDAMLRAAGVRTGLVGTVAFRIGEQTEPATHTTPESVELHALFARMREAQVQAVSMEVSSHALSQERVAGLSFSAAAFTNLTRDHLDYHGTMEAYFAAKARLFKELLAG
ncbi:MAG: Mur ligase family protein, partial [Myxococcales bacterium]